MDSFGIGISGLNAAQKAFEIIGNNIANAATDGFHRQRVNLSPAYSAQVGSVLLGGGVDLASVTRIIDGLLQKEMFKQASSMEQISKELTTLRMVESAFGELSGRTGLSTTIDEFFNALQDLSAHPVEVIWQNQAVTAAETMAGQFRTMGDFLTSLETQIRLEAENAIEEVNVLVARIADLNDSIKRHEIGSGQANNLRDQRDQCITELARLISAETQSREYGVVDVSVSGIPVVTSTSAFALEVGLQENLGLGIGVAGESNYTVNAEGGRVGALLTLKNDSLADIRSDLDSLAGAIIRQINEYHVQGVGSEGSFTGLAGWPMSSETLADFAPPVSNGNIYVRVTNTSTGAITRTAVPVDASTDTLTTVATALTAITGLTASVSDSRLNIQADANYEFDFLPCVLPSPTASDFTGATSPPTVSVSGIYTGTTNQTLTFTVSGTASVGNGTLQITVTDGDGSTVTTLNIGSGYAAGDRLDLGNGIRITLSAGDLVDGNTFEVDVFADTDTSGVLAAAGMNAFLTGSNASDMAVHSDIVTTPGRLATALGADMTDNSNALRMEALRNQAITDLNSMTPGEFYRRLTADIGQQVAIKQIHQDNVEAMVQSIANQQDEISGVNINEEAAQILIFEQMFKAMAKYLSTIQSSLSTVMDII
ncbi:MAG: flagellar hook-associated protein FlgK [Phycisphaerales bacterium]|nr:MAG: flagellar hook-associated protein FlgK [Phycisphaerales bacterium]